MAKRGGLVADLGRGGARGFRAGIGGVGDGIARLGGGGGGLVGGGIGGRGIGVGFGPRGVGLCFVALCAVTGSQGTGECNGDEESSGVVHGGVLSSGGLRAGRREPAVPPNIGRDG